jgi:hypothetical protein
VRRLVLFLACCLLVVPATAAAGTIVADNGFRPEPNGFSFPNYGDEEGYANLDASELERLFGPGVCLAGGQGRCVLTPVARTYLQVFNEGSADGHCFGFATLAELIFKGYLPRFGYSALAAFDPNAGTTFALGIERNRRLQRSIARAFTFQNLPAVAERTLIGTPKEILAALLHGGLDPKSKEIWTFEIFQYGMKAGHAITPYAIENAGDGVYQVLVYDNNWPGDGERRLEIDTKANTWSYYAMISPGYPQAQYEGNAKSETLRLAPVTPGLGVQPCPFCVGRQGGGSKYNELRLDGSGNEHAKFLVTDAQGRQTGYKGSRFVNHIPGAKVMARTSTGYRKSAAGQLFADSPAPVVRLPKGVDFEVEIDGRHLSRRDRETLSLVGPTYDATVENLIMGPRQTAHVALSPHGNAITYRPSQQTVSPAISIGAETKQVGYDVTVAAVGAPTSLTFVKVPKQKLMWFGDDTEKRRVYELTIDRIGNDGLDPETFSRAVAISGDQQAFLYYAPLAKRRGIAKIVVYSPGREKHPVKVIPIEREG